MGFKTANDVHYLHDGVPYVWGKGDHTTAPSNQVKIKASDGAATDYFGNESAVAVGCGRIVVGAYGDDDLGSASGSAYIFDLNGTQLTKIKASDGAASDFFGISVAVGSGRIVVGANGDDDLGSSSGSAYIFNINGGTQLAKIVASDGAASDFFGATVAVGCGRIVVGAYGDDDLGSSSGSAYIYNLNGTQLAKIKASDGASLDYFSRGYNGIAVGCDRIVVAAYGDASSRGAAYIFDLDGTQLAKIVASDGAASDFFGRSVAVGSGRIVVGAYFDDDTANASGSAYIFDLDGTQLAKIVAPDAAASDYFGSSVAVGSGRIVVGAYGDESSRGSTYIFDLNGNYITKIVASDGAASDYFGRSVAAGNGRIVVGAYGDDDLGSSSGSAYIYTTPSLYTIYDAIEYQQGNL